MKDSNLNVLMVIADSDEKQIEEYCDDSARFT